MKDYKKDPPHDILDEILGVLYSIDGTISEQDLCYKLYNENIENLSFADITNVMSKLVKDEFVRITPFEILYKSDSQTIYESFYSISWDGKFHYDCGGYSGALVRQNADEENLKQLNERQRKQGIVLVRLNWTIAIGAFFASVYYIIETIRIFYPQHFPVWPPIHP